MLLPALALLILLVTVLLSRAARNGLLAFALSTIPLTGFVYAAFGPHPTTVDLGPLGLSGHDFETGLTTGARLAGLFALFAVGAHFLPAQSLLPYATRGGTLGYAAGTLLRLVPLLRADVGRLRETQAARGHRFGTGILSARAWRPLLVPLFVSTLRRAREQGYALHLAGIGRARADGGWRAHHWAIVVALAALAIAGRLALISVPGVTLSYFVLFIAGVAYGPLVGLLVGLVERVGSDLMISQLNPVLLPMAPIDALLGLLAGLAGRAVNFGQREREPYAYAALLAGTVGWLMVVVFSVAADTTTWLFYRLLPGSGGAAEAVWGVYVLRGLVFNVPAMVFNALLFATTAYPVLRALRSSGLLPASSRRRATPSWRETSPGRTTP